MLEVKYIDGEFKAKGTFNWGLAGISENKDFGNDENLAEGGITIELSLDELKDEKNYDEYYWIKPLKKAFEGKMENLDGDTAAAVLTDYYNNLEKRAKEQQEQLDNYFLFRLMENLNAVAFPFWENEDALLDGYEDLEEDDDVYDKVYTEELDDAVTEVDSLLCKIQDENEPEQMKDFRVDMKALFKKYLPMFNLEGLQKTIKNESTHFEGACVSVQFSDDWNCEYFCGAYEKFEPDFIPTDWHNF